MSKLERFSAALIAVAMFATPAMRAMLSRGTTKTAHTSMPPASFTLRRAPLHPGSRRRRICLSPVYAASVRTGDLLLIDRCSAPSAVRSAAR